MFINSLDVEAVYKMLQETAVSSSEEESNKAWEKVNQLGFWRFNASFRYYLTHTWTQNENMKKVCI